MAEIFAPYKWEALIARWPDILAAFGTTAAISALALVIALGLGFLFGVLSVSGHRALRAVTRVYVELVQNIPLLLQVFVLYAVFPLVGLSLASFWIGVIAIGVYHGGYISEVVRSGIGSIHRGQFEAARSQGFSPTQVMTLVILPQAMRIILPPLAVQAANLVKNTSVLALIAGGELMYFANSFAGDTSYYGPAYVAAAVLYFALCFPLSRGAVYLERRMLAHRHVTTGDATEELASDPLEVTPGSHDITGHAAAGALAGGVGTMMEGTTSLVPARRVPSPRHPLHAWSVTIVAWDVALAPCVPGEDVPGACAGGVPTAAALTGSFAPVGSVPFRRAPFSGNQAAEIADDIGRELAQEALDASGGDRGRAWQALHTRAGRRRLGHGRPGAGAGRTTPHGALPRPRRGRGPAAPGGHRGAPRDPRRPGGGGGGAR